MRPLALCFLLLLSTTGHAQTTPPTVDAPSNTTLRRREPSPFLTNPSRPQTENIRVNGRSLTAEELRVLLERVLKKSGGGGDDVGNGGDELRQEFLELAQTTLREAGEEIMGQLQSTLDIRRIVVVNNLEVQSGRESIPVRAVVSEGIILLDSQAWDPVQGLLGTAHDPRLEMLRLMNSAANNPLIEATIMQAWSRLSPRGGRIWCPFYQARIGERRVKREFNRSGPSAQALENSLMLSCQASHLAECRVSRVITRGSGTYEMTVTGFEVRVAEKPRSAMQAERCQAVRGCEAAYDWAPRGQISPADFSDLSNEIEQACR